MSGIKSQSPKFVFKNIIKFLLKLLTFLMLLFVLFAIIVIIISKTVLKDYGTITQTFTIPSELCLELTNCYPNELNDFWNEEFKRADIEYCVDESGNLVLSLTTETVEWLLAGWQNSADKTTKDGVKISSDYTRVEFNATVPTYTDDHWSNWAVLDCGWVQLYSGVPAEDIKVEVVAMDYTTNKVVYQATWPKEDIVYEFVDEEQIIIYGIKDGVSYVDQMSAATKTFVLTAELCEDLTYHKPENLRQEWKDYFDGWHTEYKIDEAGNLVLTVREQFLDDIIRTCQQYVDTAIERGVKISSDYKRIEFDANDPIYDNELKSPWTILECAWLQVYNGVPSEEVEIEIVAMDYNMGEVVYQATWPELIEFSYTTDLFTISYKLSNGFVTYSKDPI